MKRTCAESNLNRGQYEQPMDGIGNVQLALSTARPRDLFPVRGYGPFWHLGAYGQPNVAWGNYGRFMDYTAKLNWFLLAAMIPTLAIIATAAETLFGLLLVLGRKTCITALLSGILLVIFALAISMALGVKATLNLSVFAAAGGAPLLATCIDFPFSL